MKSDLVFQQCYKHRIKHLISSSFSLLRSLCLLLFPPASSHLLIPWHQFQAVLRLSNNLVQLQSGPLLSCSAVTAAHENGETHSRGSGINISLAEGKPSPPRIPWERWRWSWLCVICTWLFCWPGRRDGNRPARHHVRTWHLHRGSN